MAFTGGARERLARMLLGKYRSSHGTLNEWELAAWAEARAPVPGQARQAYQAVARQVIRGRDAGERHQGAGGGYAETRADLPIDPTIGVLDQAYRYRVVVRVTNPDDLSTQEFGMDVDSAVPLTVDDIEQQAAAQFANRRYTLETNPRRGTDRRNWAVEVIILTAGRKA